MILTLKTIHLQNHSAENWIRVFSPIKPDQKLRNDVSVCTPFEFDLQIEPRAPNTIKLQNHSAKTMDSELSRGASMITHWSTGFQWRKWQRLRIWPPNWATNCQSHQIAESFDKKINRSYLAFETSQDTETLGVTGKKRMDFDFGMDVCTARLLQVNRFCRMIRYFNGAGVSLF